VAASVAPSLTALGGTAHEPSAHAAGVLACAALFLAGTGTAVAATGGTFLLGKANDASTATGLRSTTGTALVLTAPTGKPVLQVSNTTKISRLNADLLDGVDSSSLQRRVTASCPAGYAVRAIAASGAVVCDDEQAQVLQETADLDATGTAAATCPAGYAVTGGGFSAGDGSSTPPPSLTQDSVAFSFDDPATGVRNDVYFVTLTNVDGSPYTAGGVVSAQCVYGFSSDDLQPALSSAARSKALVLAPSSSPRDARLARLYTHYLATRG
jgi:hypothetical protein